MGYHILFISLNLLESIILFIYICALKRYLSVFKGQVDTYTVVMMLMIAGAIFCKVAVRLPTEIMTAILKDKDD